MSRFIYEWKNTQHGRRLFARPRAVAAAKPAPPAPAEDLSALKKAELVALADERGVAAYGTKAAIIERLDGAQLDGDVSFTPNHEIEEGSDGEYD